jgi:hypothetical protein
VVFVFRFIFVFRFNSSSTAFNMVLSSCSATAMGTQVSCSNIVHQYFDVSNGCRPSSAIDVTKDSLPFLMSSICSPYLASTSISSSAFPRCPIHPIYYLIFYFPAITSSSVAFFPSSFHLLSSIPFPHLICCLAVVMRHVELVHFTLSYLS